ncbi:large subunit ribosomal protein L9 [Cetobacterium ceti]|uniref:Large ribosomal subunit protein bL9 n=1 Tax=Cetobacterium ceti TaxID=180163 RepID=A0A1T4K0D2_9FUSO|nr:50S ribosomal protein L9 [Cetobacterium ceti]SJZ35829.1 large subunit ribosomal protein L9 [Cetobacterium ceti]
MAKIQVILTADVAGQGRKGEIVSVSEGYAKNFLLKNNKGVMATDEELKKIENRKKREAKKAQEEKEKSLGLKKELESKKIVIVAKTGDNGKLFGAITNKEVSSEIEKAFGVAIDRKKIECNIKALGEHKAIVKLHTEVKAEVTVVVKG